MEGINWGHAEDHYVETERGEQELGKWSRVYLLLSTRISFLLNSLPKAYSFHLSLSPPPGPISYLSSCFSIFHLLYLSFYTSYPNRDRKRSKKNDEWMREFWPTPADQTAGPCELKMTGVLLLMPEQTSRMLQMEFSSRTKENIETQDCTVKKNTKAADGFVYCRLSLSKNEQWFAKKSLDKHTGT